MINNEIKKLLKDHVEDLNNNNLDPIFDDDDAFYNYEYFGTGLSPKDVRRFLEAQGIDPLRYVTKIPAWYYEDEKLDNLDLSEHTNLKTIQPEAFFNCHIDKDLILPNSIEVVGYHAFWLEVSNLYLPDSLKEIDKYAFERINCNKIIYKGRGFNSNNIIDILKDNGVKILL